MPLLPRANKLVSLQLYPPPDPSLCSKQESWQRERALSNLFAPGSPTAEGAAEQQGEGEPQQAPDGGGGGGSPPGASQ